MAKSLRPRLIKFNRGLVVPHKYAYKSAKWLRRIRFTEKLEPGFWEKRGYSDTANGWTEVRFSS